MSATIVSSFDTTISVQDGVWSEPTTHTLVAGEPTTLENLKNGTIVIYTSCNEGVDASVTGGDSKEFGIVVPRANPIFLSRSEDGKNTKVVVNGVAVEATMIGSLPHPQNKGEESRWWKWFWGIAALLLIVGAVYVLFE